MKHMNKPFKKPWLYSLGVATLLVASVMQPQKSRAISIMSDPGAYPMTAIDKKVQPREMVIMSDTGPVLLNETDQLHCTIFDRGASTTLDRDISGMTVITYDDPWADIGDSPHLAYLYYIKENSISVEKYAMAGVMANLNDAYMERARSGGLERDVAWCTCTDIIIVSALDRTSTSHMVSPYRPAWVMMYGAQVRPANMTLLLSSAVVVG